MQGSETRNTYVASAVEIVYLKAAREEAGLGEGTRMRDIACRVFSIGREKAQDRLRAILKSPKLATPEELDAMLVQFPVATSMLKCEMLIGSGWRGDKLSDDERQVVVRSKKRLSVVAEGFGLPLDEFRQILTGKVPLPDAHAVAIATLVFPEIDAYTKDPECASAADIDRIVARFPVAACIAELPLLVTERNERVAPTVLERKLIVGSGHRLPTIAARAGLTADQLREKLSCKAALALQEAGTLDRAAMGGLKADLVQLLEAGLGLRRVPLDFLEASSLAKFGVAGEALVTKILERPDLTLNAEQLIELVAFENGMSTYLQVGTLLYGDATKLMTYTRQGRLPDGFEVLADRSKHLTISPRMAVLIRAFLTRDQKELVVDGWVRSQLEPIHQPAAAASDAVRAVTSDRDPPPPVAPTNGIPDRYSRSMRHHGMRSFEQMDEYLQADPGTTSRVLTTREDFPERDDYVSRLAERFPLIGVALDRWLAES